MVERNQVRLKRVHNVVVSLEELYYLSMDEQREPWTVAYRRADSTWRIFFMCWLVVCGGGVQN